jgi:hypothetical protein
MNLARWGLRLEAAVYSQLGMLRQHWRRVTSSTFFEGTYVIILANVVSSVSSQEFCTGLSMSSLKEGRVQPRSRSRLHATRAVDGTARFIFTGNRLRYGVVTVWQGWS